MIFFTQRFHEVYRLCIAILSMSCDSRIVVEIFTSKDSDIHGFQLESDQIYIQSEPFGAQD